MKRILSLILGLSIISLSLVGCVQSVSQNQLKEEEDFTLTVQTDPPDVGLVTIKPLRDIYEPGSIVNLSAIATDGMVFSGWSGDIQSSSQMVEFVMDSDKIITANFRPLYKLSINVIPYEGGSISPIGGRYEPGSRIELIATPVNGYTFDYWNGDASGSSNTITITLDSDKIINAHFADRTFPVISGVKVSDITDTGASIAWTTSEPATSQIQYGKSTDYDLVTSLDEQLDTNHTVSLSGLEQNTTYYFRIKSLDKAGNETVSNDSSFSTAKSPTLVGGIINQNTTWTVDNSPYNVTATIQIPVGVMLTIEPGVIVNNTTRENMFLLLGTIYAHGTTQAPIIINGGGSTIVYCPPPGERTGDFEYCIFKNGHELWNRWGRITLRYSQIIDFPINSSIIHFDGPSGEINIEYNKFINTGGISSYDDHYGTNIRYNLFTGLRSAIENAGGGTPSSPPKKTIVKYNYFIDVKTYALSLGKDFPASWAPSMDATENYWGTQDTNIISKLIYDKNDDVRIALAIDFLPILTEPHPLTPSSN